MSSSTPPHVSRHAQTAPGRLARLRAAAGRGPRTGVKAAVGVGLLLGSLALVGAPVSAADGSHDTGGTGGTAQASAVADQQLTDRSTERGASRGTERAAVSAPTTAKGERTFGSIRVDAVAKPTPKPKPRPTPEPAPTSEPAEAETPAEDSAIDETTGAEAPESADSSPATPSDDGSGETSGASSSTGRSSGSGSPDTGGYAGQASQLGLGPGAQRVYSAVRTQFPAMTDIGGYRAGDPGDHGSGRAVDIMTSGASGDAVAAWLQQHAGELGISYLIWQQRIWLPGSGWRPMEDRGDPTQNHMDHVHVSVS